MGDVAVNRFCNSATKVHQFLAHKHRGYLPTYRNCKLPGREMDYPLEALSKVFSQVIIKLHVVHGNPQKVSQQLGEAEMTQIKLQSRSWKKKKLR